MITLNWGDSCVSNDVDYSVYEGCIGQWDTHVDYACSTAGQTTYTLEPYFDPTYYLVVPKSDDAEGSYGRDSNGLERPQGAGICEFQVLSPSCP